MNLREQLLLVALVAGGANAYAQPGSRIGTTPEVPLAPQAEQTSVTRKCDTLRGEERDRCLKEARAAAPRTSRPTGPASTGMAPGAGTGSGASSIGGSSFGASPSR
jgi:hypothetical protein